MKTICGVGMRSCICSIPLEVDAERWVACLFFWTFAASFLWRIIDDECAYVFCCAGSRFCASFFLCDGLGAQNLAAKIWLCDEGKCPGQCLGVVQ